MNTPLPADDEAPVNCLVVDDVDDNLFTMSALLGGPGVQVLTARSGPEALELLLVHDVALALLDVQMPGMDGFELAEIMRSSERTRHVPLIFITAGAHDARRLFKGYDSGAVDFLYKPVDAWVLESKARVFFELHRNRRRLAAELRARNETLQLQETFAAILAHDLRDPLSAVLSAGALLHARSTDPAVQAAAARICDNGEAMARLIGDLLDLSRARLGGGIPLQPEPCDLAAVASSVQARVAAVHPQRQLQTQLLGDLHGRWDPDRMAQLLSNLLGNALRHGAAEAPVQLRLDGSAEPTVTLQVRNEGEIPAAARAHLFAPFRSSAGGARSGLGLGLYIVSEIVRAHRGQLDVRSEGGHTVFSVQLPRQA